MKILHAVAEDQLCKRCKRLLLKDKDGRCLACGHREE